MSTADIIAKLDEFRLRSKYIVEPGTLYSGMPPEYNRQLAETQLNDLLDNLKHRLPGGLTKQFVRDQCTKTLSIFESGETEDRERLCDYLAEIMDIVGVENDGLLERWLYGFDPKEELEKAGDDPRALVGSEMRSVMIYLKNHCIYVFTMGFTGYRGYTLDACRVQHPANVTDSLLGRDTLALMRASGRFISTEEQHQRVDPLASVFGQQLDVRLIKGMGLVSVARPRPNADVHVGAMQFVGLTPFPATSIAVSSADASQLGRAILQNLYESQRMNSKD
jgi:Domain of unknown function (DUF4844)